MTLDQMPVSEGAPDSPSGTMRRKATPAGDPSNDLLRRMATGPDGSTPAGSVIVLRPRWQPNNPDDGCPVPEEALCAVLERRLGPDDHFAIGDDGSFFIAFAQDGDLVARLRSEVLVEEAAELFGHGTPAGRLFEVATLRGDAEPFHVETVPLTETLDDAIETLQTLGASTNAEGPDTGSGDSTLTDVEFVFRPVVEVRTRVVSAFQCIPVRAVKGGFASGYGVLHDPEPGRITELDLATLDTVAQAWNRRHASRRGTSLALTIHFSTLADPLTCERYLSALNEQLSGADTNLILEIAEPPEDGEVGRIARPAADLLHGARRLFVRCKSERIGLQAYRAMGAHALGIDLYDRVDHEEEIMTMMDAFAVTAKRGQVRSYVLGARSISLYTAAVACGFDYVGGHALTPVIRDIEEIRRFRPDMPYVSLVNPSDDQRERR